MGLLNKKKRVEFLKMRGPRGKGCAEMAVSRLKGSGPETPDLENFPVDDFDDGDPQVRVSMPYVYENAVSIFIQIYTYKT